MATTAAFALLLAGSPGRPASPKPSPAAPGGAYTTWASLEADKCAAAWLIKRFVDKNARFSFVPVGSMVVDGIPFDTPDSDYRRSGKLSTYQVVMQKHQIRDPALDEIARIIWDIEVNKWGKRTTEESPGVAAVIDGITRIHKDPADGIDASFVVFDSLYAHFRAR
jgi:hypothetical protein